jgi:hypothetical protein
VNDEGGHWRSWFLDASRIRLYCLILSHQATNSPYYESLAAKMAKNSAPGFAAGGKASNFPNL